MTRTHRYSGIQPTLPPEPEKALLHTSSPKGEVVGVVAGEKAHAVRHEAGYVSRVKEGVGKAKDLGARYLHPHHIWEISTRGARNWVKARTDLLSTPPWLGKKNEKSQKR